MKDLYIKIRFIFLVTILFFLPLTLMLVSLVYSIYSLSRGNYSTSLFLSLITYFTTGLYVSISKKYLRRI